MSVKEDGKRYTDSWGLIQPPPAPVGTSGNGPRYTAEYILALVKHKELDDKERERLIGVYHLCQRQAGLLMRTPDNAFGIQSVDDTVGALTASYYLRSTFAKDWLAYGRKGTNEFDDTDSSEKVTAQSRWVFWILLFLSAGQIKGVYNNINPGKFHMKSWLWRQQQLVAHAQFAAGEKVAGWRKLWWSAVIIWAAFKKRGDPDGEMLSLHLVKVAKGKSMLCTAVGNFWRWKFKKKYPDGGGQVLSEHYWGPDHVNSRGLIGEFGD